MRKTVYKMIFAFLLVGTLTLAFNVGLVRAQAETVYIKPDGSGSPSPAPISAAARARAQTHPLDSFWVAPSALNFNKGNESVGTLFNITVWAYMQNGTFDWQVWLVFNPSVFQEVNAVFSAGATSAYFAGHTTIPGAPVIDNVAGSVLVGESLLDTSDYAPQENASLVIVEFNITSMPTSTTSPFTGLFDINSTGVSQTFFQDTNGNTINSASNLYDATYSLAYTMAVSISPSSVVMKVGQSQLFTSNVMDGTPPYTYQWYLNGAAVSAATNPTWTFTLALLSSNTVYVLVNDSATPAESAQSNKASVTAVGQTVYIRSDGSIVPSYAPISSLDNATYTFTGNISYPTYDGIVVERNNIVIDGNGYTVQGNFSGALNYESPGLNLTDTSNVTIKNANIEDLQLGIYLLDSNNNIISDKMQQQTSMMASI